MRKQTEKQRICAAFASLKNKTADSLLKTADFIISYLKVIAVGCAMLS
jgi:hypothetical protein